MKGLRMDTDIILIHYTVNSLFYASTYIINFVIQPLSIKLRELINANADFNHSFM